MARFRAVVVIQPPGFGGTPLVHFCRARANASWTASSARSDRLFHAQGIHSTGINAVIADADVAKATLYRHFRTKDDLIVAWLEDIRPRWFDRVRSVAETRAGADTRSIPAFLFDAIAEWLVADDFRPYLNAAAEIADPTHPARTVVREYLADEERQLHSIVEAARFVEPGNLAAQLQVMIVGSISMAVCRRTTDSVVTARAAALRLLASADDRR
jgi:AcrR family transcriptional regulator